MNRNWGVIVVLGWRLNNTFYTIYYTSKTLFDAQKNCTTTKKKLLAIVYDLEKFRSNLMGAEVMVIIDQHWNSTLKRRMSSRDSFCGSCWCKSLICRLRTREDQKMWQLTTNLGCKTREQWNITYLLGEFFRWTFVSGKCFKLILVCWLCQFSC